MSLAAQALALPMWRWAGGSLALMPFGTGQIHRRVDADSQMSPEELPDLTDPATMGGLEAIALERGVSWYCGSDYSWAKVVDWRGHRMHMVRSHPRDGPPPTVIERRLLLAECLIVALSKTLKGANE